LDKGRVFFLSERKRLVHTVFEVRIPLPFDKFFSGHFQPGTRGTMDRFLARQPILTTEKRVFAYEMLSRSGPENYCKTGALNTPSLKAIDELFLIGLKKMTGGVLAFLNCTREFLREDYLSLLPRDTVVGEILETVTPDAEVTAACRRMKLQGYRLALDDYSDRPEMEPLLEFADFIKVDFLATSPAEQDRLARKFRRRGIPLLAEKVETYEQFQRGLDMGYQFFQGYFFCRPEMFRRRNVPENKAIYLRLLQFANRAQIDLEEMGELISQEPSVSYRLLRYLNSASFYLAVPVQSIPHAVMLIGEIAMRKWISVVCVAIMGEDKPRELVRLPLVRGRFCELIGDAVGMRSETNDLFLLGLLSALDAMLDMPMSDVLAGIPVEESIKNALLGQPSHFRPIFQTVLNYERGEWEKLSISAAAINLDEDKLPELFLSALEWVNEVMSETPETVAR
jgi:EAL and modified HD-GYP domain-containing signal transduction protein